jgi:Uma2 family endonuclease
MAAPQRLASPMSVDEYLAYDDASPLRHEYVGGYVHAMTGGSLRHNLIAGNVYRRPVDAARGSRCRVFTNDVRVRVDETTFYYPDVVVVCEPVDLRSVVVRNPCLVVEVLSPSTRGTDQREKLVAYQKVGTLGACLLVEPDERVVERHFRDHDGRWRLETLSGPERDRVIVPCPAVELSLDEVYEGTGVEFA